MRGYRSFCDLLQWPNLESSFVQTGVSSEFPKLWGAVLRIELDYGVPPRAHDFDCYPHE